MNNKICFFTKIFLDLIFWFALLYLSVCIRNMSIINFEYFQLFIPIFSICFFLHFIILLNFDLYNRVDNYKCIFYALILSFIFNINTIYFLGDKTIFPKTIFIIFFTLNYLYIILSRNYFFNRLKTKKSNFVLIDKGTNISEEDIFSHKYINKYSLYEDENMKCHEDVLNDTNALLTINKNVFYVGFKRLVDLMLCIPLISINIILLPILFIINISFFDKRFIFIQQRYGYLGKVFNLYKIETYKNGKVSKYHSFLRKFRIDEIPQVLNVLKGDMSFIGPRPEIVKDTENLNKIIKNFKLRCLVLPGITGWAQVNMKEKTVTVESFKEKFAYDIYYIKNKDLFLDLKIIILTIRGMFWGK